MNLYPSTIMEQLCYKGWFVCRTKAAALSVAKWGAGVAQQ